uniref:Uncharacterized protein n=1 Tax=Arion vulgaris TaxID=1028688 RepID=A0A0B6Y1S8_9EUPU
MCCNTNCLYIRLHSNPKLPAMQHSTDLIQSAQLIMDMLIQEREATRKWVT